ncbi:H+/Cl- antiporter ClcA [Peptoniphilus ivorii]|uniref:hypothetical protein n=1 Tax=Aedoeadaptatus ivorii TaxID=54006 RepID=UPI000F82C1DC|nr:hypothetical protein [Peptoniphilus ivorii]MDQ0508234.1 H+/Cl- antiporter ClcA [Peptoniphilus ivorii]
MKKYKYWILASCGALSLIIGIYLERNYSETESVLKSLPYILVGIGCGLFGHGVGEIIKVNTLKNRRNI